jgi:hypothetical protein
VFRSLFRDNVLTGLCEIEFEWLCCSRLSRLCQWISTFVRLRPGRFFSYERRARSHGQSLAVERHHLMRVVGISAVAFGQPHESFDTEPQHVGLSANSDLSLGDKIGSSQRNIVIMF